MCALERARKRVCVWFCERGKKEREREREERERRECVQISVCVSVLI